MMLPPKPKREDHPMTDWGENHFLISDRNYERSCKEVALKALAQFAAAHEYAVAMAAKANLSPVDARDYAIWQASRRLCPNDFKNAAIAVAEISSRDDDTWTPS